MRSCCAPLDNRFYRDAHDHGAVHLARIETHGLTQFDQIIDDGAAQAVIEHVPVDPKPFSKGWHIVG